MLKLHKDLPKAKTPHERESLQRQMVATDKVIDKHGGWPGAFQTATQAGKP
jgi:hypothetical protein